MEIVKEVGRAIVYVAVTLAGEEEIYAETGTWKYRVLAWLYGEGEEVCDGWIYPEGSD